jgi:hypothetical protein
MISALSPVHAAHSSEVASSRSDPSSWLDVAVLSFDGQSITTELTLSAAGDHQNATVRVWGESPSGGERTGPCFATICFGEFATFSIGRAVREVIYSRDTDLTTFRYVSNFSYPFYQTSPALGGVPFFSLDEHRLNITITTDFDTNVDEHIRRPLLPTTNYEGAFQVRRTLVKQNEYTYVLTVDILHSSSFKSLMFIVTWVTISFAFALTIFLFKRQREGAPKDNIVTVSSAIVVFLPVFEISLQSFKAPLTITISDIAMVFLFALNAILLVLATRSPSIRSQSKLPACLARGTIALSGGWFDLSPVDAKSWSRLRTHRLSLTP